MLRQSGSRIAPIVCLINYKTFLSISCSAVGYWVKSKIDGETKEKGNDPKELISRW